MIAIAKAHYSRIGLNGKKLKFEWQNQTITPNKKPEKWLNQTEIQDKTNQESQKRVKEDFRREMFDLNPKQQPPKIEVDEIYGTNTPELKPFDTVDVQSMFSNSNYEGKSKISNLKIAYLKDLNEHKAILDSQILDLLVVLENQLKLYTNQLGFTNHELISEQQWTEFFTSESILSNLKNIKDLIAKTNYKNLPDILLFLSLNLHYTRDFSPECVIFEEIEKAISLSLHIFTPIELAKTFYGLTAVFPKRGSIQFRSILRQTVFKLNFDMLSVNEVLLIYTCFRNETNTHVVHEKCYKFLISKFDIIKNVLDKKPTLALEIVYTFANSKPLKRYRKVFKIINEEEREDFNEQDQIEHLYMPFVLKNLHLYKEVDFLRLLSAFKILTLKNYDEAYYQLQTYILDNLEKIDYQVFAYLIYYSCKTNVHGFGTRSFWKDLSVKVISKRSKNEAKSPCHFIKILYSLVYNKSITIEDFLKHFGDEFLQILKNPVNLQLQELSIACTITIFLDMKTKNKEHIKPFFKEIIRAITFKNEWIPSFYYLPIKYFIWYLAKKYPKWNMSHLENLSYHAEKTFSTSRMRKSVMNEDILEFSNIIQKQLDMNMMSLVDFENIFLIDFAVQDFRFGIFLRKTTDCLYYEPGEERIASPLFELKKELLALDDWTVCTIDVSEFKSLGDGKIEWLKKQIEESYAQSRKKIGVLTEERLRRIENRIGAVTFDHLVQDPTYDDHAREIKRLEKEKFDYHFKN